MKGNFEKAMRYNRIASFLLALLLSFGSFSALFVGILPEIFTAEALDEVEAYYADLDTSKQGTAFRSELAELITETHTTYTSYKNGDYPLSEVFAISDADPDNPGNILWFYTGTSVSFNGSFSGNTNREHVWPKNAGNAFPEETGPGSDAHHLRPTNSTLNSTRGSMSFDEVPQTTANIVKENGSSSYGATADELCYRANGFFYPAEGYRGATARILMYLQVRWGNQYSLSFVLGSGSNKTIGDIETLMQWHLEEPPTDAEIRRNEAVADIQGNRNPFIDHPEYASKIYCYDGKSYNDELLAVVEEYGDYDENGNGGNGGSGDDFTLAFPMSTLALKPGDTCTLTPTVTPEGAAGELLWWSGDASILEVDQKGNVRAIKNGTTDVYVASKSNTGIYASMEVTVRTAVALSVSGTPSNLYYTVGQKFNPAGLTVKVSYSDGTNAVLSTGACKWLDGVLGTVELSKGSTSVNCVYGGLWVNVGGITVGDATKESATFDRSSFSGSGAYAWQEWSVGDFKGQAFMYAGETSKIQMNSSKNYYYLFNTTPIPAGVTSITVKLNSGEKDFEILTSPTPYDTTMGKVPTTGTSHGTKSVGTGGTTWTLNTSDPYFTINYKSTGVVYIESVTFHYGGSEGNTENAWDASAYAGIIETQSKASIRLNTITGLRFATEIDTALLEALLADDEVASVSYGHLIAPTDLLGADGLIMGCTHPMLQVTNKLGAFYEFDDDPNTTHFVGSIIEIKEQNMDREFSARGYIEITLVDDSVIYMYSAVTHAVTAADQAQATLDTNFYPEGTPAYEVLAYFAAYNK